MDIKYNMQKSLLLSITAIIIAILLLGGCGNMGQVQSPLNEEIPGNGNEDTSIGTLALTTAELPRIDPTDPFSPPDPQVLVNNILGPGVFIPDIPSFEEVVFQGQTWSAGTFSGGTGIIDFESGIILSTGNIVDVPGPNGSDGTIGNNNLPGDTNLDTLVPTGYATSDATVLEINFIPTGSSVIMFDYVFGSEEYNEYVNSPVTNVLGFFVNGVNQAFIPGTSVPVAVNNVNNGNPEPADTFLPDMSNPGLYRDNDISTQGTPTPLDTELDGLTTVFSFVANVNKGSLNNIKLAIANWDGPDNGSGPDLDFDSAVFIREGSFISPPISLEPLSDTNNVGTSQTVTATVELGGIAQSGVSVSFEIVDGPHDGKTGTATTDSSGQATWSYTGISGGPLPDKIIATATINSFNLESNPAYKIWQFSDLPSVELQAVEYAWGAPEPGFMWDPFPDVFEGWLNVRIANTGAGDAFNVTTSISSQPINTNPVDPNVIIGDIPSGGSAWSVDTFTTRVDLTNPVDPCEGVFWRIGYDDANGVHHVIENVPEFPPGEGPCSPPSP